MTKFQVVTICGSMRFYSLMLEEAERLTSEGWIVLMPFVVEEDPDKKETLDEMHRGKINWSDCVHVVFDETRYMGESTTNELIYAARNGKEITFRDISPKHETWCGVNQLDCSCGNSGYSKGGDACGDCGGSGVYVGRCTCKETK